MKVFNYIRVSSKEQNEARQLQAMAKWNKDNGITNAIELIDKATGTNTDRTNLQLLLKVIGEGDIVVIKSIDRLSRNYKECKQLWEKITMSGADIVVIDMPILDTRQSKDLLGTLISDIFLSVLGYVAQQENEFRKQRQKEGIDAMPLNDEGKRVSTKTNRPIGRPTIQYPNNWEEVYTKWINKEITARKAMELTNLKTNTFYKLAKNYAEELNK